MIFDGGPRSAMEQLSVEVTRHTHSELPLTLAQFRVSPTSTRRQRREAVSVLRSHCRRHDHVIERERGSVLVLAPNCPADAAEGLVSRTSQALDAAGISATGASATFPSQVVSVDALLGASTPPEDRLTAAGESPNFEPSEMIESGSVRSVEVDAAAVGVDHTVAGDAQNSALKYATWLTRYARHGETRQATRNRMKRFFDIIVVISLSPLWLPALVLIATAIWLSSPGDPILFRQRRSGRLGETFEVLKFRTMVSNAEELKSELAHLNEREWPDFKISNDPRITSIGRILRKTSLDELPQLINVLRGDMSLVGPRPHSLDPRTYDDWHSLRFEVLPGLTGLWQVCGRHLQSFDDRVRLDIAYIERYSLRLDLMILVRTIPAVVAGRGE